MHSMPGITGGRRKGGEKCRFSLATVDFSRVAAVDPIVSIGRELREQADLRGSFSYRG